MTGYRVPLLSVILLVMLALQGCVFGAQLRTETADPKAIQGTYDLILYGCRFPADYEHAAFLISTEAKYPVSLFAADTSFKIKQGVSAEKALMEAYAFVRCGIHAVDEVRVHRIADDSGGTIGYEVLPRYPAIDITGSDPVLVNYSLKNGKITVYIQMDPQVERRLNQADVPEARRK